MMDAAMRVFASSHVVRTNPPFPRADLYALALSGFSTILFHALTGSFSSASALDQIFNSSERIYGNRIRCGLYVYHEKVARLCQPRGSYSGMSVPVGAHAVCGVSKDIMR